MSHNINIALSPNNTKADTLEAVKQLVLPWKWFSWQRGDKTRKLESQFRAYFDVPHAYAMNSGREALYTILQSLDLKEGDEIILQSFTCMVVVNAITWNGLTPVYADMSAEDFNIDPEQLKKKITKKTKAVIVQHTFGIPAQMEEIQKICKNKKLILIEDCAHAMGATYTDTKGKEHLLGTVGDFGFYSLGRSKVISCVTGGMIVAKDKKRSKQIEQVLKHARYPKRSTIARNLLHPIAMNCIKKLYNKSIFGKVLLVALQKAKLLTMEVEKHEKRGNFKPPHPLRMSNALAALALHQFALLDQFNTHRRTLAQQYYKSIRKTLLKKFGIKAINPAKYPGAIFLRYPIILKNEKLKKKMFKKVKHQGIILGDWYSSPIAPPNSNMDKTNYQQNSCIVVEDICTRVLNLPTYHSLTEQQAEAIIKTL